MHPTPMKGIPVPRNKPKQPVRYEPLPPKGRKAVTRVLATLAPIPQGADRG